MSWYPPPAVKSIQTLRIQIQARLRTLSAHSCPSSRIRVEVAIACLGELLDERPDFQIALGDVANLVCLERTYCCRMFRKIAGAPFKEWLRKRRIGKATLLLRTSGNSITLVAHAVGYSDITTFERNFVEEFGMCPTKYRRRWSNELPAPLG
jgi:AraC-like DNA-binding protein